jgi:hypothetical protein
MTSAQALRMRKANKSAPKLLAPTLVNIDKRATEVVAMAQMAV